MNDGRFQGSPVIITLCISGMFPRLRLPWQFAFLSVTSCRTLNPLPTLCLSAWLLRRLPVPTVTRTCNGF